MGQEKYNLKSERKIFEYPVTIKDESDNDIIINYIKNVLNLDYVYYEIIHKQIENVGLKYHIDDCSIVTKNTIPEYNNCRYIHIFWK